LLLIVTGVQSYVREDVWFWDDATYLGRGIQPDAYGPPSWVDSPLYSGMYALLAHIAPNPITLYFLGRLSSAVVLVACIWIAARLLSRPLLAWSVAALATMLPVTYIWPGVSAPASGLLIVAVALAYRWPTPLALAGTAGLTWLAAGSRPEFTWLAAALSVLAIAWWARQSLRTPRPARMAFIWLALLGMTVGIPLLLASRYEGMFARSSREWTAFSQHFALRNTPAGQDSWQSAGDVAARAFPGASSIMEALLVNPVAFLEHIGRNALQLPLTLVGHGLAIEPPSLLAPTAPKIAAVLLLLGLAVAAWMNRSTIVDSTRSGLRTAIRMPRRMATVALAGILLGSSLSMIVIYPRPHYLLLPLGLLLVAMAAWLSRLPIRRLQTYIPIGTTAVLFLIFAAGTAIALPNRIAEPPAYESALREVQRLGTAHVLVSGDRPIELYLPGVTFVEGPPPSAMSVQQAFDSLGVDVVQMSALLTSSPWTALDGFDAFYDDPGTLGFHQVTKDSPIWVR
jgi:hypothetical protein